MKKLTAIGNGNVIRAIGPMSGLQYFPRPKGDITPHERTIIMASDWPIELLEMVLEDMRELSRKRKEDRQVPTGGDTGSSRNPNCLACNGSGHEPGLSATVVAVCRDCRGTGRAE